MADRSGPVPAAQNAQLGGGNTRPPPRARHWVFTLNNYTEDEITQIAQRFEHSAEYVFQEEKGSAGTPHLQGAIFFKSGRTFAAVKRDMPNRAHIEKARGSKKQAIEYCTKSKTRNGRIFANMPLPEQLRDPLSGKDLRNFQSTILDLIKGEPDDRSIYWYWDSLGGCGKSSLVKHICLTREDAVVVSGKGSDVKYVITTLKTRPKVILWDLPRSLEDYVSYTSMEEVKNGCFMSTKYESQMYLMNPPHVIVFANFPPDTSKMSGDRWKITEITL